jgi:hypothetical protein
MNLNHCNTKDYETKSPLLTTQKQSQNKPNQTQPALSAVEGSTLGLSSQLPALSATKYQRLTANYFFLRLAFFFFGLALLPLLQPQVLHIFLSFQTRVEPQISLMYLATNWSGFSAEGRISERGFGQKHFKNILDSDGEKFNILLFFVAYKASETGGRMRLYQLNCGKL